MNENFPGITKEECDAISGLKVSYTQYIKARNTLLTYSKNIGQIKKRDAGKLCRMDVNKSGKLYDYFYDNKWLS